MVVSLIISLVRLMMCTNISYSYEQSFFEGKVAITLYLCIMHGDWTIGITVFKK
jgi:hypothetical protein